MGMYPRVVATCAGALMALGTLSACSGAPESAPAQSDPAPTGVVAEAFPPSASFVADMERDGRTMTIGIEVDGDDVTAYACNGSTDEAWFFGDQTDGRIDLTSRFRDTLSASFDGTDVEGDLTMDGVTFEFTASPVEPPAGIYTADADGSRAAWIVRPDG